MTRQYRRGHLIVLGAIAWNCAIGLAAGQAADRQPVAAPLGAVKASVPIGDIVHVTDNTGVTIKGKLVAVTDDGVQVNVGGGTRSIAARDLHRIRWQKADSPITGVLIGAAAGAAPGIYWLIADPNECTGMCPEEYALIGIGALVGGLIDRAITRKVTVYEAASGDRSKRVSIGPLLSRDRRGLQVAVMF